MLLQQPDLPHYAPLHTSRGGKCIIHETPTRTVYVVGENAKTAYQAQKPWNIYEIVVMSTGIEDLDSDKTAPSIVDCYDLSGKLLTSKQRGAVIVRYSDRTTRKVLLK